MAIGFSPFHITLSFSIHIAISQAIDFLSYSKSIQWHMTSAPRQVNSLPAQFLREKLWVRSWKSVMITVSQLVHLRIKQRHHQTFTPWKSYDVQESEMPDSISTSTLSLILWPQQIFFCLHIDRKIKRGKNGKKKI